MEEQTKETKPALRNIAGLLLTYVLAYLYTYLNTDSVYQGKIVWIVFSLIFCLSVELIYHKKKAKKESWIWLISLWVVILSYATGRSHVWGEYAILFSHVYAVYWLLSRSDTLLAGESSYFLPFDIFLGFVVFPFKYFFLRLKTLGLYLSGSFQKHKALSTKISIVVVLLLSATLLYTAVSLLASADDTFDKVLGSLLQMIYIEDISTILLRFTVSLPIGAYLFGLLFGIAKENRQKWNETREGILAKSASLRKIPATLWIWVLSAFSVLYFAFFALQGSYLFGAFFQRLPDNFTAAQYARQGFFELCGIMVLNFTLIGLVAVSNQEPLAETRGLKTMTTLLLIESLVFATISFSKLYLYIQRFGFTALRLQSTWLVLVLFFGCCAALYSLKTGKKSMQPWILFSGVSLALFHLL